MANGSEQKYRQAEQTLWRSFDITPDESWLKLRRGENVRVQSIGSGPPLVFLHGGSSSGANWAPLVDRVRNRRCLLIDRPGCGLSDPVAGDLRDMDAFERFADGFLADVLDGLEIEVGDIVATSMGGYLAMRGIAAHPDRVRRQVQIAFPLGAPTNHAPLSMRIAVIPGLSALTTRMPVNRFAVKMILKQLGLGRALDSGRLSDEFIDWFVALLRHTDTMANEVRANPRLLRPIAGLNERLLFSNELLGSIRHPSLFIWGGEDPLGGEETGRPFAARFPDARFELLPLAGHAPWIDEPEQCATWLGDFLAEADGA